MYNLAKQALAKKLVGSSGVITCLAVHPGGDHVLVGSDDKRLAWYDLDLSATPYKALRYHTQPLRGVAYHNSYPLFASASDDGSVHVFHGRWVLWGMVLAGGVRTASCMHLLVDIERSWHACVAAHAVAMQLSSACTWHENGRLLLLLP